MRGNIFNIQKFCTKDGPGIRTTVFLKGCPLHCLWCHNPESQSGKIEHMYEALEMSGYEISVEEVIKEVLKDKDFYENSGGGITLSGGEPLFQTDFCLELLREAKKNNLHVCMETCGFAERHVMEETAGLVDIYLFDYKETNPARHKEFTGVDNKLILDNLKLIDELGKSIVLRCPIIPGYNDREEHFAGIAAVANKLKNLVEVEIEPYHTFGAEKYKRLDKEYHLSGVDAPDGEIVDLWIEEIKKNTRVKVSKA